LVLFAHAALSSSASRESAPYLPLAVFSLLNYIAVKDLVRPQLLHAIYGPPPERTMDSWMTYDERVDVLGIALLGLFATYVLLVARVATLRYRP